MNEDIKIAFGEDGKAYMLNDEYCIYCANEKVFNKVKEAVEKQIKKKPKYQKNYNGTIFNFKQKESYSCPDCGKVLYVQNHIERSDDGCKEINRYPQGEKSNHCKNCGQAIDWSDAE